MAFKIHTQATLTPQKPQESKPQKPQISQITPQSPTQKPSYDSIKKPLGSLDSSLPQTSNSAFSSLFLSQKNWLQKEFGITDQKIQDLLKENQQNHLADFLWQFQWHRI